MPRAVSVGSPIGSPSNNYSATAMTDLIGPEGAQTRIEHTAEAVNGLWVAPPK